MRRFVVIGRTATASPDFSLVDLPGTSGRLDVLLRCVRAALLVSHGVRRDTTVYLVLLGGPDAPRTVRIEGASVKFLRPDERSMALLLKKSLAAAPGVATAGGAFGFAAVRPGISVAAAGLEAVREDVAGSALWVLERASADVRAASPGEDVTFFVGDHLGLDQATRDELASWGAKTTSLGPEDVHADDAIAIVSNELDRRTPSALPSEDA